MRKLLLPLLIALAALVFANDSFAQNYAGGLRSGGFCGGTGGIVQPRQVTRVWNVPGGVYIERAWQFGRRYCGPNPHARPDYYQRHRVVHHYPSVFSPYRYHYPRSSFGYGILTRSTSTRESRAEERRKQREERLAQAEENRAKAAEEFEAGREAEAEKAAGMEESYRPFAASTISLLDAGRNALSDGKADQAVQLLRDACAASPSSNTARAWLAVAASIAGRDQIATIAIEHVGSVAKVVELAGGSDAVSGLLPSQLAAKNDDQSGPARLRASILAASADATSAATTAVR
jgi:hypothetical protein